jgi:hypothetical protein
MIGTTKIINMAATALKIKQGDKTYHFLMVTIPGEKGTDLAFHTTNDKYEIDSKVEPQYGVNAKDEDQYHKDLRVDAEKAGEFIPEFSTNPEWNPVDEEEAKDGAGENRGE